MLWMSSQGGSDAESPHLYVGLVARGRDLCTLRDVWQRGVLYLSAYLATGVLLTRSTWVRPLTSAWHAGAHRRDAEYSKYELGGGCHPHTILARRDPLHPLLPT